MKTSILRVLVFTAAVLGTVALVAQNYVVEWFSIDGGSATSSGGTYAVTGTAGQPDAGALSGGRYGVVGGFWSIGEIPAIDSRPSLSISQDPASGAITMSWPLLATGFVLEQTSRLDEAGASWVRVAVSSVTNATDVSVTLFPQQSSSFFRLRKTE